VITEPKSWKVGRYDVLPCPPDDHDGRGLLYVWEEAKANQTYVIGVDPTMGVPGWNRQIRTKDDVDVDNAAISVIRKGRWTSEGDRTPDVQVAEWAAPVDPYDLAHICNVIGKTYAGDNEDGQALMGIEVYPGPGWATATELTNRYGYMNFPPWLVTSGLVQRTTHKFGWHSSRSTRQDLWTKNVMLVRKRGVIPRSPWLIDEMADCTPDSFLSASGRARNKLHDDRVVAFFLAVWFAQEWGLSIEPTERTVVEPTTGSGNWQAQGITSSQMKDLWEERFSELMEE
jgi:hypothetical protein